MTITVPTYPYPEGRTVYGSLLECMAEERIFEIEKNKDGNFEISEACDVAFSVTLTKEQLKALGQEIIDFVNDDNAIRSDQLQKLFASKYDLKVFTTQPGRAKDSVRVYAEFPVDGRNAWYQSEFSKELIDEIESNAGVRSFILEGVERELAAKAHLR